ncbi:hypothetical protein Patl1_07747 [Pistacia atlantica]|uniref:Uncharacterized protein n=1 Tax=Pistacia atlantica TaxID=434234 RepID=A0ACC1AJ20_9ROSI|nr:hypothetical protein Patl1_07747 [Pistacia atlantica]
MEVLKHIKLKEDVEDPIRNDKEGLPLSPMARLFHKSDSSIYIIVMVVMKTEMNPEVEDETVKGGLKWVNKKEVDLDKHVIVPMLDPNNIESPDKFVEEYTSNLSKTGIKMSMPMRDRHLLNLRTSDAESVAVFRVHHSLGDGVSLMSYFLTCTRKTCNPEEPPTIPIIQKVNPIKSSGRFRGKFIKSWLAIVLFWSTLVDVVMFLATALSLLNDTKTPLKGSLSQPRRFVRRSVSLDDVKLVKTAMKTVRIRECNKINKEASEGSNNLPHNIRLRAAFFMNLRRSPGIHECDDMMKEGSKARYYNSFKPLSMEIYNDSAHTFMPSFQLARLPTQTTLYFSNVFGPQEEISFCGYPVAYIVPSCYGQPTWLLIHVMSYTNRITFSLSVDEGIIPDPEQLCDDLEDSFNLIKSAVIAKGMVMN